MKKLLLIIALSCGLLASAQTKTTVWNLPVYNGSMAGTRFLTDVSSSQTRYVTYETLTGSLVKYTDTAFMFSAYLAAIHARVKFTDTATMLLTYLNRINANEVALTGKANTSHTHAGTDITSGTVAPARLASGSLTSGYVPTVQGDGSLAYGPQSSSSGPAYANVKDYGATGDGSNQTTAFLSAAATGKPLWIPKGRYLLNTATAGAAAVILSAGQSVFGEEGATVILQANRRGFWLKTNAIIDGVRFVGSGKANGQTFEGGILVTGDVNCTIRNCVFDSISGANTNNGGGCIIIGSTSSAGTNWKDGSRIINCRMSNSAVGINFDQAGEYITTMHTIISFCTTGISMRSGNNKFIGCSIDENTTGLIMTTGSNDAHGGFVECTFNHNATCFSLSNITQGERFTSCTFYGGNGSMTSCVGVRFFNCDFYGSGSTQTITLTTVTLSLRDGCRVPTTGASATTFSGTGMTAVNDLDF